MVLKSPKRITSRQDCAALSMQGSLAAWGSDLLTPE